MSHRRSTRLALLHFLAVIAVLTLAGASGCGRPRGAGAQDAGGKVLGTYDGGVITEADYELELDRFPPSMREQYATDEGKRQVVSSLIDERLLGKVAMDRGYGKDARSLRQVQALERKLAIQALVEAEAKEPTEEEIKAAYNFHMPQFSTPERAHVLRILVKLAPDATPADKTKAEARAKGLAARLQKGEPFDKVAALGDGDEKSNGGDIGYLARGKFPDTMLEDEVFNKATVGKTTGVVSTGDGLAILRVEEKLPAVVPTLQEMKEQLVGRLKQERMQAAAQRMLAPLRKEAKISITLPAPAEKK
jgi:parvulin-like peptidyl-prolyl isomerase